MLNRLVIQLFWYIRYKLDIYMIILNVASNFTNFLYKFVMARRVSSLTFQFKTSIQIISPQLCLIKLYLLGILSNIFLTTPSKINVRSLLMENTTWKFFLSDSAYLKTMFYQKTAFKNIEIGHF